MKRPFLPLLPFLIKYPFINVPIFNFDGNKLLNDLEGAKELVKKVVEGEYVVEGEPLKLLCGECVTRDECDGFEHCTYPSKDYSLMLKRAEKSVLEWRRVKVVVSNMEDFLRRRFAVRLARAYRNLLRREDEDVLIVLAWGVGLNFDFDYLKMYYVVRELFVGVDDYLRLATKIGGDEWKLVNRKVSRGRVYLNKDDFVRLIEERLREIFEERVPVKVKVDLGLSVKRDYKFESLPIKFECFPECMKRILMDLKDGKNVPHVGRFAITAFLINLGCDVERIIELFRNAPDFNEEKTRYQVEHIAGLRGKGEKYVAPNCETMRSWGLCVQNCDVNHPVKYYRRCLRGNRRKGSSEHKGHSQNNP